MVLKDSGSMPLDVMHDAFVIAVSSNAAFMPSSKGL